MFSFDEKPRRQARIEIIPMIDVMMFLLVFFVLISINVIPSQGLQTSLPQASNATQSSPDKPIIITLTKDNKIEVNGKETSVDGIEGELRRLSLNADKDSVIIKSDSEATMQQLVSVMDVLKTLSVQHLSIATRPKAKG